MGLSDFPNLHKIGLKPHFSAKIVYAKNAFSTLLADYGKSAFFRSVRRLRVFRGGFRDVIQQSSGSNDFLHKFRERLAGERLPGGLIGNHARIKIHLYLIPRLDGFGSLRAFQDRQADINGIPEKDPGKGFCNNAANPRALKSQRRVLPGRSAAEIFVRHHNIPFLHLFYKFFVNILRIQKLR